MQYLSNLDLAKNELQNPRIHQLSSAPGSPVTGQMYYDTVLNMLLWWNGSAWKNATGDTVSFGAVTAQTSYGAASGNGVASTVARSDHTHGTPAHGASEHSGITLSDLAAPTASLNINSQRLTGVADPSSAQDAATKAYVDATAQGLTVKAAVRAATTANITLSGAQTIDGVSVIAGDRVLVKDQSTASQNGIYVAAAGAWSRSPDADTSAEVTSGMFVFVAEGTTNADSGWVLTTNNPITLGSTSLAFAQFSGAGQITAGTGMTKTGNTLNVIGTAGRIVANDDSVDIDNTWAGQAAITTLGTITTGTWNATDIAVSAGGTGASDAATARTNLGVPGRYAVTFGGSTSQAITHNLNTLDVVVEVYVIATGAKVECDVTHTSVNVVTLGFANAPAASSLRCVVVG